MTEIFSTGRLSLNTKKLSNLTYKKSVSWFLYKRFTLFIMNPKKDFFQWSVGSAETVKSRVMRKPDICLCENKGVDQLCSAVTAQLISTFVFITRIVQFLFFLNPKYHASNHLQRLYRPVCVGPGRKPQRPVFSRRGSYVT